MNRGRSTRGQLVQLAANPFNSLYSLQLRCCGVTGGSDYHSSWWRLRELGQRELLVPLSCCDLDNAREPDGFLDPRPTNLTLCQSLQQDAVRPYRHMEVGVRGLVRLHGACVL